MKAALTTCTESPRSAEKPTACFTNASMLCISIGVSGVETSLPSSPVVCFWFTSTATDRRRMVPVWLRVTFTVRSTS